MPYFDYPLLIEATIVQATIAAVSVLNLVVPIATGA